MDALLAFLADPVSWQAEAGIPNRILEHVLLSLLAVAVAALVALPLGSYIGHTGRLQLLGINLASIGRAVPSYALMVMLLPLMLALAPVLGYEPRLGLRFLPIFLAMTLLAIPPILVATYVGLAGVDRDVTESARGMGLSEGQVLWRVELPLALHIIVGGVRIALLQVIATATIGAYLAGGGLGRFIIDGIARRDDGMLYAGVLLVAVLAIGSDVLLSWVQRRAVPRGVRLTAGAAAATPTPGAF